MPSVVDMIAQAEAQAESINAEAAKTAQEIVSQAVEAAAEAESLATAEVKRLHVLRKESAMHNAEILRKDILDKKSKAAQENARHAEQNIDKAVKYIIERITKA